MPLLFVQKDPCMRFGLIPVVSRQKNIILQNGHRHNPRTGKGHITQPEKKPSQYPTMQPQTPLSTPQACLVYLAYAACLQKQKTRLFPPSCGNMQKEPLSSSHQLTANREPPR